MTLAVVLSGAAGLIFQIVWLYECSLAFGNSLWSATIVLTSFMLGLAVGNAIVARLGGRIVRPLRVYAALESTVAVSGLLLTYALPHVTQLMAFRFYTAIVVLAIPTVAMGATLPVVVGAVSRGGREFGRVLGHLYGWNTIGAVVGVVGAEVVLVRYVGVKGSAWVAAALDFGAAAIAMRAAFASEPSTPPALPGPRGLPAPLAVPARVWFLLVSAALAGGVLLSLEVVWFRFLTLYVLSTTLTVSLMLASVLAAIGVGGLAASAWIKRRRDASMYAAAVALLAGCSNVVSYAAFGSVTSGTQIAEWTRVLWLACALTALPSFFSGMFFTLLGDAIERSMAEGGDHIRAAAWLTQANTVGAMFGPAVAAFILLPRLGMEGAFFALALAYLAVAAFAFRPAERRTGPSRKFVLAFLAVLFGLSIVQFPFGRMRDRYFTRAADAYSGDGSSIIATREGSTGTIFLMRQAWLGKPVYDRLVTDGFSMSGTAVPGMRYMRAFAYWPMLLHQGPLKRALVVCYGVGVTAQAVTDISSLASIDVVEISRDVVAMSDVIYEGAKAPLHDPRVRLHIEDGRNFLRTSLELFDLITGEPPPPRTPGAVNIYTREYFQLVYDRLADGGMATYWLPVARPSPGTDVDTVVRAFCDVFSDCSLWNATPFDLMLVGSRHAPGHVSEDAFAKPWVTPGLEARLREVGFEQPEEIGATFLGGADYLRGLTANAPELVDDFPQRLVPSPARPSLSDPRYASDPSVAAFFQRVIDPARARELFQTSPFVRRFWPDALIARTIPAFEYQRIINRVLWEGGKPLRQIEDLHFLLTHTTLRTLPLWVLGSDEIKQRIAETSDDRSGAVEYARGLRAITGHGYAAAAGFLAEAERRAFGGAQVRALRAYALCMAGEAGEARTIADGAHAADADEEHFWQWIKPRIASGGCAN